MFKPFPTRPLPGKPITPMAAAGEADPKKTKRTALIKAMKGTC